MHIYSPVEFLELQTFLRHENAPVTPVLLDLLPIFTEILANIYKCLLNVR